MKISRIMAFRSGAQIKQPKKGKRATAPPAEGLELLQGGGLRCQRADSGQPASRYSRSSRGFTVQLVRMTYDFLDRITEKILPDGSSLTSAYLVEDHNNLTRATDPQGNITEKVRGLRDEIKAIRKKDTTGTILTSTSYTYDPLSQLLEARDHRDNPVNFTYDLAGNRRTVESPDGGLIEYFYDYGGNLIRKLDPNLRARGQAITYKYDDFYRLVLVDYPRMLTTTIHGVHL